MTCDSLKFHENVLVFFSYTQKFQLRNKTSTVSHLFQQKRVVYSTLSYEKSNFQIEMSK